MRKSVSIWPVLGLLVCIVAVFLWSSSKLSSSIGDVQWKYDQARVKQTQLENEQIRLKETLEKVGTDAFIENQARTLYGYMKPDEIRFVITNPEVLYGSNDIPTE